MSDTLTIEPDRATTKAFRDGNREVGRTRFAQTVKEAIAASPGIADEKQAAAEVDRVSKNLSVAPDRLMGRAAKIKITTPKEGAKTAAPADDDQAEDE